MKIITNNSLNTSSENMINNKRSLDKSAEKLATGKKINAASDNASGLAIADKLRTQVTSINQSIKNSNSGAAMMQVADKALTEHSSILDVVKQKLIQAKTATTSAEGRDIIRKDIIKLVNQIDNIASTTNYNGTYLLQKDSTDTSASDELEFQVGELSTNTIDLEAQLVQANSIGYNLQTLKNLSEDGLTVDVAGEQMGIVDEALNKANLYRSDFGMIHNQLKAASRNLNSEYVNLSNAESVIRDTKYSEETAKFSKNNIIQQSGSFAMSQATKKSENALNLVK